MRARLFAKTGELAGSSFEITDELTVGRAAENQVVLPGSLVSGRHARIAFDPKEGCFVLEDLGSRNGTFLAGTRIREPERLGRLDVVNFAGAFDFLFQVLEGEAVVVPMSVPIPVPPPIPSGTVVDQEAFVLPAFLSTPAAPGVGGTVVDREAFVLPPALSAPAPGGTLAEPLGDWILPEVAEAAPPPPPIPISRFALQVETEDGPRVFDLPPGEHVLGRADDCAIPIDDRGLSRRHAKLVADEERVCVVDLGSTNQTTLSGKRVFPDDVVPVEPGAELVFGALKAVVVRR